MFPLTPPSRLLYTAIRSRRTWANIKMGQEGIPGKKNYSSKMSWTGGKWQKKLKQKAEKYDLSVSREAGKE